MVAPCLHRRRANDGLAHSRYILRACEVSLLGSETPEAEAATSGIKSTPIPNFQYPPLTWYTRLHMLPDPFTTDDGDVILRAGPEPGLKHDFRVHKIVLSLLSPVFKGLFQVAQPDAGREEPLPIVPITDTPESVDLLLRLIYPGRVPPIVTDPPTLSTLMTIADKYGIQTVSHAVKERLADEKVLEKDPFGVYVVARRWGFLDEAKGAARGLTLAKIAKSPSSRDPQATASDDFLRLVWFMQKRRDEGSKAIRRGLGPPENDMDDDWVVCGRHTGGEYQKFYEKLAEVVTDKLEADPCLDEGKLALALMMTPDPPHTGFCDHEENPPEIPVPFFVYCPARPSTIVSRLSDLATELEPIYEQYLNAAFDGGFPF